MSKLKINCKSVHTNSLIFSAKCIDSYTKKRTAGDTSVEASVDARQEEIVNRMFQRCFNDGQFKQAMGIAIETKRMDMFVDSIRYDFSICQYNQRTIRC